MSALGDLGFRSPAAFNGSAFGALSGYKAAELRPLARRRDHHGAHLGLDQRPVNRLSAACWNPVINFNARCLHCIQNLQRAGSDDALLALVPGGITCCCALLHPSPSDVAALKVNG
jgi:hypothetical protein